MIHPEPPRDDDIQRNTETAHRPPSDCCIFKVQNHLREVNKEAYEPNIIAIGPYHSGKKKYLQLMEGHKQRYLQKLLDRKNDDKTTYIHAIDLVIEKVQKCYAEPLDDYGPDKLVLDGCFIIELVRKSSHPELREENDPVFRIEWIINSLKRDLLLFENQIPFFIICKLFNMTQDQGSQETFTRLARDFFMDILPGVARKDKDDSDNSNRFKHLLGLVHSNWLPLFTRVQSNKEEIGWINGILNRIGLATPPILDVFDQDAFAIRLENFKYIHCVADLKEAGIKFEKGKGNMFDIRFVNGTIIIPPFIVENRTESFFRNLIAHEQYRQGTDCHFVTDYVKFMDCLINSPRDVGSLRRRKIIHNWLGEDEVVSKMFNQMTDSVVASGEFFHYKDVFNQVEAYYQKRRHRWMATLRRRYLSSPWAVVSILAAFVLLVLTLVQTVFTIIG